MFKIDFIQKMNYKFGKDKFDYSLLPSKFSSKDKIILICKKHGEFEQRTDMWLFKGCSLCNIDGLKLTTEQWVKKAQEKHNNHYSYDRSIYTYSDNNIIITCPIHGDFEQIARNHLIGAGCSNCSGNKKLTIKEIIEKAQEKHKDINGNSIYEYTDILEDVSNKDKMLINCPIHGQFEQRIDMHLFGAGCPKCYNNRTISKQEIELSNFISMLDCEIETSNRTVLSNNKELDIYIPSKQIAIEYNGLYWHSELHKDKKYHLQKTEECLAKGIRLIHIFEDEWINKTGIVKSRISNILGVTKFHTYARKCNIKITGYSETNDFLNNHHIQGSCNSTIQIGLYQQNKLLAVMTFGPLRRNLGSSAEDGHYELLRFCNFQNLNIVGGASKLLKYFIKNYRPKEIISYCDRRWSDGNLYEKLGFQHTHNSPINYFYIKEQERKNRFGFRKDILVSKYGCSPSMTEREFCFKQGWYRIYDCGTKVYKLTL